MKKALLTYILLLSACVTSQDYGTQLQNWVGANRTTLIDAWGSPAAVNYLTPNQQLLTYFQMSPDGAEFCRTTFTLTDGNVTDFTFEGDNCSITVAN